MTAAGHVVLVGLSGSGKSTVGWTLAARLGRDFVDTDDLIVQRTGRSIPDLFRDEGEAAFRAIERDAVADAVARPAAVIATGGGAPVDPANRRRLWDGGTVVWLDAPVEVLAQRVGQAGAGRPLLSGDAVGRLTALREARESVYAGAHLRLDTEALGIDRVVEAILDFLESRP
ncbi:MAG TPA: shikimate kinase [Chloroflexota bacterium]|nr:shikimate kinase [Chloroflexota bacterium]